MAIIYKYTNTINNKVYVGQTVNPRQRKSAHSSSSGNINSSEYDKPFYVDIRKYGWDNFIYEVLEECDISDTRERENFYIDRFNSIEEGYNICGGSEGWSDERRRYHSELKQFKNTPLDYEDVVYIRQSYLDGKKPSELYPEFKHIFTHYFSFMNVWAGARYAYVMPEVFDIRPNRVKLDFEKAQEIRGLYKEDGATYQSIANLYGVGKCTIRDVITNHTWKN